MFWQRFYDLCIQKGIKPNPLAQKLGISSGVISKWKNENTLPNGENLVKIADYLGVSVDYLLGLTDIPDTKKAVGISADSLDDDTEKAISYLNYLAQANPEALQKAAEYAKFLVQDNQ